MIPDTHIPVESGNYSKPLTRVPHISPEQTPAKQTGRGLWSHIKEVPIILLALIASVLFFIIEKAEKKVK